jgi:uncharacterized protein
MLIKRHIQTELEQCLRESPVVAITGPRQAGKTTLAKMACPQHPYVSFEDPLVRNAFHADPRGFLENYRAAAIFDEAQHVPELFSFLQGLVDAEPGAGRFVLTGSQHFGLSARISQSLAGRVAVLELLPFSAAELADAGRLGVPLNQALWTGAYPPVHDRVLRPARWYADYVTTYVQRDVRQVTQVHDLDRFTRFLRLCAGCVAQLFNASRLGADLGADRKTVNQWLSVLQAGYVVATVPPFSRNVRRRVVKAPKLFFYDCGLVCHLLGIHDPEQLDTHPLRGAIFENWVFAELAKAMRNTGRRTELCFWRTHGGQEVDFLFEVAGRLFGVEAKAGMTVRPGALTSLRHTLAQWPELKPQAVVVHGGDEESSLLDCRLLPWRRIGQLVPPPK